MLVADEGWSSPYRTMADQSFGWDAVIDGGQVLFMDNGDHTYQEAMAMTGQGVAAGPAHLVRVPVEGGAPELVEICGLPHGTQTNLPACDPARGIAVGYDSGNGVLAAFDLEPAGLVPRWRRELGTSMHLVRFPDTGELIVNDRHDGADDVVVINLETGDEKARAATGSPVQSVVFPAVDHAGALWYCSFTTLARSSGRIGPRRTVPGKSSPRRSRAAAGSTPSAKATRKLLVESSPKIRRLRSKVMAPPVSRSMEGEMVAGATMTPTMVASTGSLMAGTITVSPSSLPRSAKVPRPSAISSSVEYLSPRVGDEVAEALMAGFPTREGDELVTREFLRAEVAELRTELTGLQSCLITTFVAVSALATTIIVAFG